MLENRSSLTRVASDLLLVAVRGQQPAEHRHLFQNFHGTLIGSSKGLLTVGTESGIGIASAKHAIWVPHNHKYWMRCRGATDEWIVYIAERACDSLPRDPCLIQTSELLHEAVLRAATWSSGPQNPARARVASIILDEIQSVPGEPFGLLLPRDLRLQKVAQALIDDPSDRRCATDWAACVAVNVRTLSRRFVDETGVTFQSWRQQARILRSLEMMVEGQQINTIALNVGFSTSSSFIAFFRKMFGETPVSFRSRIDDVLGN